MGRVPGVTVNETELQASDLLHAERFPSPATPEIHVTLNVRFLPAFSVEAQTHLAPDPNDQEAPDDERGRPQPAVVVPTMTSPISSGLSRVRSR